MSLTKPTVKINDDVFSPLTHACALARAYAHSLAVLYACVFLLTIINQLFNDVDKSKSRFFISPLYRSLNVSIVILIT